MNKNKIEIEKDIANYWFVKSGGLKYMLDECGEFIDKKELLSEVLGIDKKYIL